MEKVFIFGVPCVILFFLFFAVETDDILKEVFLIVKLYTISPRLL